MSIKVTKIRELFHGWDTNKENYLTKHTRISLGMKDILVRQTWLYIISIK